MSFFIRKPNDLVFNRWTVPRADSIDDPTVEGRAIEAALNDLMGRGVCVRHIAGNLLYFDLFGGEREKNKMFVPILKNQPKEINSMAIEPRNGSGLESSHAEAQFPE